QLGLLWEADEPRQLFDARLDPDLGKLGGTVFGHTLAVGGAGEARGDLAGDVLDVRLHVGGRYRRDNACFRHSRSRTSWFACRGGCGLPARGILRQTVGRVTSRLVAAPVRQEMAQDQAGVATSPCDRVTLEIVRGALRAIQSEMEAVIERTAMSPFIREKKDFYAALYDADGRLIAGSNLPGFGGLVGPIAVYYPLATMRSGDICWFTDCYGSNGAVSHSPAQVFVAPVFAAGELSAFAQSWAHFNDIGGMRPGSLSPDCTDIFQEGIIVPPVRLAREGAVNEEL